MERKPKYLLLQTNCGFNDILCSIQTHLKYCKRFNRILLVNGMHSLYGINLANYFQGGEEEKAFLIFDTNKIREIIRADESMTVYPAEFDLQSVMDDKQVIIQRDRIELTEDYEETIVVNRYTLGGNGFPLFKTWTLINEPFKLLEKQI